MFASVQLALLGPLEVSSGLGRTVLSAPKERAVLEMLALRPGRPVQAELLYEGLWGQNAPPWQPRPCTPIFPLAPSAFPRLHSHSGGRVHPAVGPGGRGRASIRTSRPRGAPAQRGRGPKLCGFSTRRRAWGSGEAARARS